MSYRFSRLASPKRMLAAATAALGLAALAGATLAPGSAQAAALPTVTATVSATSISVSGALQAGAVNITSTATGGKEPSVVLFLLKLYFARTFGTKTILTLNTHQIEACQVFVQKLQEGAPELAGKITGSASAPAGEALKDFRVIAHQARIRQIEATIGWLEELQGQAEAIALAPSGEKSAQPS